MSFLTAHVNPYTGKALRDDPTIMVRSVVVAPPQAVPQTSFVLPVAVPLS